MIAYVILVDGIDAGARNRVTEVIKTQRVGWWHWFQSMWIVADTQDRSPVYWRELAKAASGAQRNVLVLEAGTAWAGRIVPDAAEWLRRNLP